MTEFTHLTAPTQFVDAGAIHFAYRRFGKIGGVPLVFLQHFTGNIDNWDPQVVDAFAQDREVVLFNNAGVASTSGETPDNVEDMARDAISFIDALGLAKVDILGFSLGGMVAQQITLDRPALVRRLVLVGTGPRGGEGFAVFTPEVQNYFFVKKYDKPEHMWLDAFFTKSAESQASGQIFLKRLMSRVENRDVPSSGKVGPAQVTAVYAWGAPRPNPYDYLKTIKQPALVINGQDDIIIPTVNSYILQQNLPNAHLILYPDSNHGAQYQFPELFVAQVTLFLSM